MAYNPNRISTVETPSDHIGLNVHPWGYIYGYEHVKIENPDTPPKTETYPDHPDPQTISKDIYLIKRVVPYKDIPHHRNTYIIPAEVLGEYLEENREWAATYTTITPHTRKEALKRIQRFTEDANYETLKELAANVERVEIENAPTSI